MTELKAKEYKKFENIKHIREDGSEFWSARELGDALEYTQRRNFSKVIERAMIACENSGHDVFYDFAEVSKIVDAGATNKLIKDYELSRYRIIMVYIYRVFVAKLLFCKWKNIKNRVAISCNV